MPIKVGGAEIGAHRWFLPVATCPSSILGGANLMLQGGQLVSLQSKTSMDKFELILANGMCGCEWPVKMCPTVAGERVPLVW